MRITLLEAGGPTGIRRQITVEANGAAQESINDDVVATGKVDLASRERLQALVRQMMINPRPLPVSRPPSAGEIAVTVETGGHRVSFSDRQWPGDATLREVVGLMRDLQASLQPLHATAPTTLQPASGSRSPDRGPSIS